MLLNELKSDYQLAVRKELLEGEELLWWAQPDVDAVTQSLLPFSVIWLSGLFLMSVGMMINAPGDTTHLLVALIVVLVLVACAGVLELIFVPRRAARTIFLLTNKRAISICITKKLNPADTDIERRILRVEPSKPERFYLVNLPSQLLMLLVSIDVVRMLARHFDLFLALGFGLIITGWMRPWLRDMRYPQAKFRDAPKVLYSVDDMFISTESLQRELIRQVKIRRVAKDLFNVFLISDVAGTLRFRLLLGKDRAQSLLEYFGVKATKDQMSNL